MSDRIIISTPTPRDDFFARFMRDREVRIFGVAPTRFRAGQWFDVPEFPESGYHNEIQDDGALRISMPRAFIDPAQAQDSLLDRTFRQTMRKMMEEYTGKREQEMAYEVLGEALAVIDQLQAELDALKNAEHPAGLAPSLSHKET